MYIKSKEDPGIDYVPSNLYTGCHFGYPTTSYLVNLSKAVKEALGSRFCDQEQVAESGKE